MSTENKIVDLEQWNRQRQDVADLAKSVANGTANGDALLIQSAKLQDMTSAVIEALLNDMGYLNQIIQQSHLQMGQIAQQTFLALEVLKRKEVVDRDELHQIFQEIMNHAKEQEIADQKAIAKAMEQAHHPDMNDPARLAHYNQLLKQGFTEDEARVTAWPEQFLEQTAEEKKGAEVVPFPSKPDYSKDPSFNDLG